MHVEETPMNVGEQELPGGIYPNGMRSVRQSGH